MGTNISGIKQPKAVVVLDEDRKPISTYNTLRECARQEKIPVTSLYNAIKNKKTLNGHNYEYL